MLVSPPIPYFTDCSMNTLSEGSSVLTFCVWLCAEQRCQTANWLAYTGVISKLRNLCELILQRECLVR
jgi:hypothetical protein